MLEAEALLSKTDLFVGEPAILKIRVRGSKKPETPDLSHIDNFTVVFKDWQREILRSVILKEAEETLLPLEAYSFFYEVCPKYRGHLVLPAIDVFADGFATRTNFIAVNVQEPVDSEDFKLRIKLSKPRCYIGEPVVLTVIWYIGKSVKDYHFDIPLLEDNRFRFADAEADRQSGRKKYRIPFGSLLVMGEEGRGIIDDKEYTTITFRKILIPVGTGNVTIEPASISFKTPFRNQTEKKTVADNAFPDSINGDAEDYRNVIVQSNPLNLVISELPKVGRPSNFTGHVGPYRIKATATPTMVGVGDPILLTLSLSGPEYVGHVGLPDLRGQSKLSRNFKLPEEWSTVEISGNTKVFTLPIRPLNTSVKEIPPIELPCFDTETGKYRIAKSNPVPLIVKEAKVPTPPGIDGTSVTMIANKRLETSSVGITFNYEDMSVLEKQYLSPLAYLKEGYWVFAVFFPPIVYVIILTGVSFHQKRNNNPMKKISRKALNRLNKNLRKAKSISSGYREGVILASFKQYLGLKFGMSSGGSITFSDAKQKLESIGAEEGLIGRVKALFESCEMGKYGGNISLENSASLVNDAIDIVKKLEKRLEQKKNERRTSNIQHRTSNVDRTV